MDLTDEQRAAFRKMDDLARQGDSPEYREAFEAWRMTHDTPHGVLSEHDGNLRLEIDTIVRRYFGSGASTGAAVDALLELAAFAPMITSHQDDRMNGLDEWWEYGYRTASGEEVWAYDHGGDGEWTPARPDLGMPHVEITHAPDHKSAHRTIYEALVSAGVEGAVITRRVHRGEVEEVERPS